MKIQNGGISTDRKYISGQLLRAGIRRKADKGFTDIGFWVSL
jgi:hypothetical protein